MKKVTVEFTIKAPSFSVNKMYYANKMNKTTEARAWTTQIQRSLMKKEAQEAMKTIRESFNETTDFLSVELEFYYPEKVMFTKENKITCKKGKHDVSNIEKPLIDIIYDDTYSTLINNLAIDDANNLELHCKQGIFEEHIIVVRISVLDRKAIPVYKPMARSMGEVLEEIEITLDSSANKTALRKKMKQVNKTSKTSKKITPVKKSKIV